MTNPNPGLITNEMWRLWTDRPNLSWKLGGIYANKPGYHNTVNANLKNWPGNYSIELPLDLVKANRDKARAIDLTMTDSEMVKWTKRMRNAALDPSDTRLEAVKEFYGTLDNTNVFGLSKDSTNGPWERSTADSTHLWHGHVSIFTTFVSNWVMLSPLLSVWGGETLEDWKVKTMFIQKGDTGQEVSYWQSLHNAIRTTVTPSAPALPVDGIYGDSTASAFADMVHKQGGQAAYTGQSTPYWMLLRYQTALIIANTPEVPPSIDPEQLTELVTNWLSANVKVTDLSFNGSVTGKVNLS